MSTGMSSPPKDQRRAFAFKHEAMTTVSPDCFLDPHRQNPVIETLSKPDITVTNQGDKLQQLYKLTIIQDEVKKEMQLPADSSELERHIEAINKELETNLSMRESGLAPVEEEGADEYEVNEAILKAENELEAFTNEKRELENKIQESWQSVSM